MNGSTVHRLGIVLTLVPLLTILTGDARAELATTSPCNVDAVPAATLLVPYFEVEVDLAVPILDRRNTAFTVTNADADPHLVHLTLWTNWAVPTLNLDVYLSGFDVQSFNVIDLFTGNFAKAPGEADGPGPMSSPNSAFPNCSRASLRPWTPHFASQLLRRETGGTYNPNDPDDLPFVFAHLRSAHLGQGTPDGQGGQLFWGEPVTYLAPDGVTEVPLAVGYVTLDVVNRCSASFPSRAYFRAGGRGIASNENVLLGDVVFTRPAPSRGFAEPLVHVRADADAFDPGDYTFYSRYTLSAAADERQPLGSVFASRYLQQVLGFTEVATEVIVWRDPKRGVAAPLPPGRRPSWWPLRAEGVLFFDEEENVVSGSTDSFPLATQLVDLATLDVPYSFGWMILDLGHAAAPRFGREAQAWVVTLFEGEQASLERFATGMRAMRLASPCDP